MFRIPDTARLLNSRRTGVAVAACLSAAALVAGCGGGARVKPFQPQQIIAFGDENSAFDDTATLGAPLVDFKTIPGAPTSTADVPYRARYTINVIADRPNFCKTSLPTDVFCASSAALIAADYPSDKSFFVPQSSIPGVYRYSVASSIIPVVNEVFTGSFNDGGSSPPTIYLTTDHTYYCSTDFADDYGNWVQRLAHGLGGGGLNLGGATGGCPQDGGGSRSYAKWGAKVADVVEQFNTNRGELRDGVLVTLLAGQNDIMAAYAEVVATPSTEEAAKIRMSEQGAILGALIKSIVATGARVVYLTVPDMGKTPKAVSDGKTTLANDLTKAFNEGYLDKGGLTFSTGTNGHKIVKVDGYSLIASLGASHSAAACQSDPTTVTMPNGKTLTAAFPSIDFGALVNADFRAKALLLNCRSNNLRVLTPRVLNPISPAVPNDEVRAFYRDYLWADDLRLAPLGHGSLANLAASRIRDQL
ncbi:SGNH/GDSL hydrolase family protein [Aquabacterium sp.]|uniref:SGNH/GDSL hydrolase family protein n=1 Tax=Aquabacterium sp. TaxID=1872578 RepID=UPI0019A897C9|nr:SGNH/GDSL hydrolase family protein [Aquabacterium sp.]MBC7699044.1 hypothetical protein [Aquabacterium sp.]